VLAAERRDSAARERSLGQRRGGEPVGGRQRQLEHDPEKWVPVFGKDHAQTSNDWQARGSVREGPSRVPRSVVRRAAIPSCCQ
jgi:hypothetical protein